MPAWQLSPVEHALPSSHGVLSGFGGFTGQVPPEHAAWIWHWSAGGHVTPVPPVQVPAWQVSPVEQELPSSHGVPLLLGGLEQPVVGEHVPATWHWSSAVQVTL